MLSRDEREHRLHLPVVAEASAKKVNKAVDRLRVDKCPGRKRWITFREWDGPWIVSSTGINDFSPLSVDRVNDLQVDFADCMPLATHLVEG